MRHPAHDARHGKDRGVDFLWQAQHLVDESGIEVEVGADGLLRLPELRDALHALLLYELQEVILLHPAFLLGELAGETFQFHGARVAHGIDGMANAIDKSRLVVGLLAEHAVEVGVNLVDVGPVGDILLQVVEHVDALDVGASMQRAFQRAYARRYARIGVGAGRACHSHGERGVVTSAMLRLGDEQEVEHARVEVGIVALEHVEEVLGNAQVLLRVTDVQAAALHGVAIDVVSVGHDRWELGYKLHGLPHEVVAAYVVGVGVECVHLQHAARQDVHDVRALDVDDVHYGAVVERHVVVEKLGKRGQFLLVGELAREQEVSYLLEAEPLLLQQWRHEVVELIATVIEASLARLQRAVLGAVVADDVAYVCQSHEHA